MAAVALAGATCGGVLLLAESVCGTGVVTIGLCLELKCTGSNECEQLTGGFDLFGAEVCARFSCGPGSGGPEVSGGVWICCRTGRGFGTRSRQITSGPPEPFNLASSPPSPHRRTIIPTQLLNMAPRPSLVSVAARQLARAQPQRSLSALARPLTRSALGSSARPASLTSTLARPARAFTSSSARLAAVPARAEYKKLTPDDVKAFASFLSSPSSLVTTIPAPNGEWTVVQKDDLEAYNKDWMDKYFGESSLLLKPRSTEEVSKIMAYCYEQRIAVVPQGGNTGLVGGGVPVYDEVILSTEGMKEVRHFDDVSGEQHFLTFPPAPPTLARPLLTRIPTRLQVSSPATAELFLSRFLTTSTLSAT